MFFASSTLDWTFCVALRCLFCRDHHRAGNLLEEIWRLRFRLSATESESAYLRMKSRYAEDCAAFLGEKIRLEDVVYAFMASQAREKERRRSEDVAGIMKRVDEAGKRVAALTAEATKAVEETNCLKQHMQYSGSLGEKYDETFLSYV